MGGQVLCWKVTEYRYRPTSRLRCQPRLRFVTYRYSNVPHPRFLHDHGFRLPPPWRRAWQNLLGDLLPLSQGMDNETVVESASENHTAAMSGAPFRRHRQPFLGVQRVCV